MLMVDEKTKVLAERKAEFKKIDQEYLALKEAFLMQKTQFFVKGDGFMQMVSEMVDREFEGCTTISVAKSELIENGVLVSFINS